MGIALVRAAAPMAAARFLERLGSPVERLMERSKLSPRALEHPESLVPFAAALRFVADAARSEGVADLGLRIGQQERLADMGTFGRLLIAGPTLREALDKAYRSWSLHNSGVRAWLTGDGEQVHLHHAFVGVDPADAAHWEAAVLSLYTQLVQLADATWRPRVIQVAAPDLPGWRAVPALANARVEFGRPALRVTFPARLLRRPLGAGRGAPSAADLGSWQRSGPANDFGGSVRQLVAALLADGYPDVERVAAFAGTSTRTLQRRLGEEGLTYARVVAQARLGLAERLLEEPERKIIDIAFDLGYSDPAHFTRAFRGWTGLSPREFRRRARPGSDPIGA